MHQVQKVQEAYFLISLSPDYLPDPAIDHCCIVLKMHFHEDLSRSTRRSLIFKKSEICKNHDRDLSKLVKKMSPSFITIFWDVAGIKIRRNTAAAFQSLEVMEN